MLALVIDSGRVELRDVPAPTLRRPDDCLIRVHCAGVCGTDLQLLDGYAGFAGIPGHEFVGTVVHGAGPSAAPWIGRRVVGEINVACGECAWCAAGTREHCDRRDVMGIRHHGGAFADYVVLPAANLHAVPDAMSDRTAVFAEPVAAACRVLEQIEVAGKSTLVLGDGRLGLLVAQVLRGADADVSLVGKHSDKLRLARALGLEARTRPDVTGRYDIVVDATGRREGLTDALALVRPRGTVVLKSTFHGTMALEPWPIVVDEITIVGSRCGPFSRALEVLSRSDVQVEPLIAGVFPLSDGTAALDAARRELKVLIEPRTRTPEPLNLNL